MRKAVIALSAAALFLMGSGPAFCAEAQPPQKVYKWKLQSANPAGNPHMDLLAKFAANIDKMSGGRLKIEILPSGAVVAPFDIGDAVSKGVVDAGQWWPHYAVGKNPAAGLFSAPLGGSGSGLDQMGQLTWYYRGGGRDLYIELYQKVLKLNVMPFLYAADGPEAFGWFKKPITTNAEFLKSRFRMSAGLPSDVLKDMGGIPMALPGDEIIPAAERGLVDGVEWINPSNDLQLGLYDVFKFYSIQGLHQAIDIADILINLKKWQELPPDLQAVVEVAVQNSLFEALMYFIDNNSKALKVLTTEKGVKLFDAPPDYAPAFIASSKKVLQKFADENAFFKKVLDSQKAFAKQVVPYTRETSKLSTLISGAAEN
ncbi:MAG: TRAP transporter substrate-binding protein [Desulfobacteraceae bacterium]|nr:TRAP transporter substrate-binding protein [Desulfobacteraceae bacterium]